MQCERGIADQQAQVDVAPTERLHLEWSDLHDYEKCVVHRRRAGMTLKKLAKKLKLSKLWVNSMELGRVPCAPLTEYWRDASRS